MKRIEFAGSTSNFSTIRAGLIGAVVLAVGLASYLGATTPAYQYGDEAPHVGYAVAIRQGHLPSIDTPVPIGHGDEALDGRVAAARSPHHRDIYVANNPPHFYVLAAPITGLASWLDAPGGQLAAMRLLSAVSLGAAALAAFLLGRELAAGDALVGLATATVVATTTQVVFPSSISGLDGPALAATTAVTWAAVRFLRNPQMGHASMVGLGLAAATSIRPMAMAYGLFTAGIVLVFGARHLTRRVIPCLALRVVGPATLIAGWYYALNIGRYGDPTGSSALMEKVGRTPSPHTLFDLLRHPSWLIRPIAYVTTSTETSQPWLVPVTPVETMIALTVVVVVFVTVAASTYSWWRARRACRPTAEMPAAWISVALMAFMPVVLMAKHVSAGGSAHPRYLLPAVPLVAACAAVLVRRLGRWALVVPVAALALSGPFRTRQLALAPRPMWPWTDGPLIGDPLRMIGLIAAGLGALAVTTSMVLLAHSGRRRRPVRRGDDRFHSDDHRHGGGHQPVD